AARDRPQGAGETEARGDSGAHPASARQRMGDGAMSRKRVFLHVGTPKTGTSFLQDVLFQNRSTLRDAGINYPASRFDGQFLAALDLMRLPWGGLEQEAVGAWEQLAEEARSWSGTTIISHEIFAHASSPQVKRALDSLRD